MIENLTWTCHVCHNERPDEKISVLKIDRSEMYRLPEGTIMQNVRYCNDRDECRRLAPNVTFR